MKTIPAPDTPAAFLETLHALAAAHPFALFLGLTAALALAAARL